MNESKARRLHREANNGAEPEWRKPGPRDYYSGSGERERQRSAFLFARLDMRMAQIREERRIRLESARQLFEQSMADEVERQKAIAAIELERGQT